MDVNKKKTKKERLESAKKKLVLPKPGELVKTSTALCSCCVFSSQTGGGSTIVCDYYLTTGIMRGCKYGECNKFERRTTKKVHKQPF